MWGGQGRRRPGKAAKVFDEIVVPRENCESKSTKHSEQGTAA